MHVECDRKVEFRYYDLICKCYLGKCMFYFDNSVAPYFILALLCISHANILPCSYLIKGKTHALNLFHIPLGA